jgi:hypothetical protein
MRKAGILAFLEPPVELIDTPHRNRDFAGDRNDLGSLVRPDDGKTKTSDKAQDCYGPETH